VTKGRTVPARGSGNVGWMTPRRMRSSQPMIRPCLTDADGEVTRVKLPPCPCDDGQLQVNGASGFHDAPSG
jgi:hypothetical protein